MTRTPFMQYTYECAQGEFLFQNILSKGLQKAFDFAEQHKLITAVSYEYLVTFKDSFEATAKLAPLGKVVFCREWKTVILSTGDTKFILECSWGKEFPYNKLGITCWTSLQNVTIAADLLKTTLKDNFVHPDAQHTLVTVNWFSKSRDGGVSSRTVNTTITEVVHPEAYPYIELDTFIKEYLVSSSPVLLLTGTQGTGKTRLIRHIIKTYMDAMRKDRDKDNIVHVLADTFGPEREDNTLIAYTTDADALYEEDLYVSLRLGNYQFIILEDIDFSLSTRKDGNDLMHKFLALSDGFMASSCRIIFSTNLNINEVDPALIRPGRCFAAVETRPLVTAEANALAKVLTDKEVTLEGKEYTVAEVYNQVCTTSVTAKAVKMPVYSPAGSCNNIAIHHSRRIGFGKH